MTTYPANPATPAATPGHHDLGPLGRRQQVQHALAAPLRQLGHGVGRVVGAHPREQFGDLGFGAGAEQPGGQFLIEFFEDVGFEFGVGVHVAEDLGLLRFGGVFEQVGDLRGLEPPDAGERAAQHRAAGVADERLELPPVPRLMWLLLAAEQAEQAEQPAAWSIGTKISRPPTVPTMPVTSGYSAPRSRTITSDSFPRGCPLRSASGRPSSADR